MLKWFASYKSDRFVRRNFITNTFDGAIYSFAMSFVSLSTVIPVFVKSLTHSAVFVGLIPVLWTLGFNFPQIIMANYVRKIPFKKPLLIITALGQRLPWLLLALFSWVLIGKLEHWLQGIVFLILLLVAAVCGSLNLPGWFDLIAKITPVNLRGRLFASRSIVGALLGILGGIYVKLIIDAYPFPDNFAILFLSAFIVMMVSYSLLFLIKETHPNAQPEHIPYKEFITRIPQLLRKNRNFRNYLIADSFFIASLIADTFFAINGIEKFSLSEAYAGTFTVIMMVSIILGNIIFGYIGDHRGHKINMTMAAVCCFIACMLALTAPSILTYSIVFVFSASTATLLQLSRLPIIAELCAEDDRPTYVAITNMITSPFILFGVAGGWIAAEFGYNFVFILASFFAFMSAAWYIFKVKEPRKLIQQTI